MSNKQDNGVYKVTKIETIKDLVGENQKEPNPTKKRKLADIISVTLIFSFMVGTLTGLAVSLKEGLEELSAELELSEEEKQFNKDWFEHISNKMYNSIVISSSANMLANIPSTEISYGSEKLTKGQKFYLQSYNGWVHKEKIYNTNILVDDSDGFKIIVVDFENIEELENGITMITFKDKIVYYEPGQLRKESLIKERTRERKGHNESWK